VEVKRIKRKLVISTYLITFEYETHRGYRREQQRTIRGLDKENVKESFRSWAKKQRTMTNVKILAIDEVKEQREEFEI
jgi:hypothetical protein